jgi:hypothetical protein
LEVEGKRKRGTRTSRYGAVFRERRAPRVDLEVGEALEGGVPPGAHFFSKFAV